MRSINTLPPLITLAACCVVCLGFISAAPAAEKTAEPIAETITAEELSKVKAAEAARIATINKVYGSVVAVYGNKRQGGGSGVIFDEEGYALTNFHVVNGAGVEGWGGLADGKLYRWKLVGMDPGGDIAIIKLTGKDKFPYSKLGDSDKVRVGDWVMAMGNPFTLAEDQKPTVTLGVVSGIKRYQPGAGKNMLVYGNCIQVDSSINPGNSGGPLFNLRGEVVGINGRGSFKERGRVNVGVGYAISSNQIKTFIPDLLATKVAQHGTLDAVFSDRSGGVICHQINLDSKIALLGLDIGDRLIAFDGIEIDNANLLTNHISTLPAGWPVQVVFEHNGRRRSVWVRLDALPYGQPKANAKPQPKPQPKPKEGGKPKQAPIKIKLQLKTPGVVRDAKMNKRECGRILKAWAAFAAGGKAAEKIKALRFEEDIIEDGKKIGSQTVVRALDGRFRLERAADKSGSKTVAVWDGKVYWTLDGDAKLKERKPTNVPLEEHVGQGAALGRLLAKNAVDDMAQIELEGSDRTQNRRTYRIRTEDNFGNLLYLWFSLYDDEGNPQVRLLKVSRSTDGLASDRAQTLSDYREVAGLQVPHLRRHVSGLVERTVTRYVVTKCEPLSELPDDVFRRPKNADKKDN
ncbi:MAG: trypsin-like peptidase domain-containing protein [Planctomycetes bacterium]|nr:trypsin-like peptidase domain-containing protein [Planctomycetota bacterium]